MEELAEFVEHEVFNPEILKDVIAPDAGNSINWKSLDDNDILCMMYL